MNSFYVTVLLCIVHVLLMSYIYEMKQKKRPVSQTPFHISILVSFLLLLLIRIDEYNHSHSNMNERKKKEKHEQKTLYTKHMQNAWIALLSFDRANIMLSWFYVSVLWISTIVASCLSSMWIFLFKHWYYVVRKNLSTCAHRNLFFHWIGNNKKSKVQL